MGRRRKNFEKFIDNGNTLLNNDTGLMIVDGNKGVNDYLDYGDISMFSNQIVFAFKNNVLLNLSDYWMHDESWNMLQAKTYIENMGFEYIELYTYFDMYEPWQNDHMLWLKSWDPGLNVNKFGCWSKFEMSTPRVQQVEHIDRKFNRHNKYDDIEFFKTHDKFEEGDSMTVNETESVKREQDGLWSFDEGRKFKQIESPGFMYKDGLYKQEVSMITKAERR